MHARSEHKEEAGQGHGRLQILVVGDDGVGKTSLVSALCGAGARERGTGIRSTVGCGVSVRRGAHGAVEEYYDVCGGRAYASGRDIYLRRPYDAVIFVHDLSVRASRAALARHWAPLAMRALGHGRVARDDSSATHVRSTGVLNEFRLLYRQFRSAYVRVSMLNLVKEVMSLGIRLVRLVLHETDVWSDRNIDEKALRETLDSSSVPVAIVGMKRDVVHKEGAEEDDEELEELLWEGIEGRDLFVVASDKSTVEQNGVLSAFLERSFELAERNETPAGHRRVPSASHVPGRHVALTF